MSKIHNEGKQQRRSRNDQEGRNFHCGCGKSYLSYTALYTHIKVKHEGKAPEGTKTVHTATDSNKRGRPRKIAWETIERPKQVQKVDVKPIENTAEEIEETFCSNSNTEEVKVAVYNHIKEYNWLKELLELVEDTIKKQDDNLDAWLYEEKLANKNCQYVLAEHVYDMMHKLNINQVESFLLFINAYKEAIDVYLYETVALYQECEKREEYSKTSYVNYLPEIANTFITCFISKEYPLLERELAITYTFNLCIWLKKKNYTQITIHKL